MKTIYLSLERLLNRCAHLIRWETLESDFQKWQSEPMADLDNILIFVKVAQFESISRAARSLGMPISTVSRRLSVLETELGVSLLRRTTRRVTLTPQGRDYFNQCQEPLTLLQEAERVLSQAQRKPEGLLRITVPVILGQGPFLQFISRFLKDHPRIRIDLFITNTFIDLVAENIDAAIRFGELQDSSVVASRLGKSIRYVVAAPEYLKSRKVPAEPADLAQHDCVMLNARHNETVWDLVSGRKKARVHVSGPLSSRDFNSASIFVYQGHGVGLLPSTYCEAALAEGRLVRLLPKWTSPQIPVFAVYPSRKFMPARLSVFLQAVAAWHSPQWIRE
jgi:DNA-binding transcriptional LysR family regulator